MIGIELLKEEKKRKELELLHCPCCIFFDIIIFGIFLLHILNSKMRQKRKERREKPDW